MDRAFESGAVVVAPSVPAVPSVGYPTGGNPVGGVPATKPGPYWFHMLTEEMRAVIVAGGVTPDAAVLNQLLQSLPAALASRPEMTRVLASAGYQKLPGGLILQWGSVNGVSGVFGSFPIAFPTSVFRVMAVHGPSASALLDVAVGNVTLAGFNVLHAGGGTSQTISFMALGN